MVPAHNDLVISDTMLDLFYPYILTAAACGFARVEVVLWQNKANRSREKTSAARQRARIVPHS